MSKKKILLCWGYNRNGWIAPFEEIKSEVEFIYLFFRSKEEENASFTDCKKVYWYDFESGFDILEKVQPDAVVFMSIVSGYPIALHASCLAKKVPTYILQHGLFRTYKEYREIEKTDLSHKKKKVSEETVSPINSNRKSTLQFLLSSLTSRQKLLLPLLLLYFKINQKQGQYFAAYNLPFKLRRPTKYICYTPRNATIHKELDRVNDDRLIYTGIPELDKFFSSSIPETNDGYYLLVDQAFAENQYYDFGITKDQMNACYHKLNIYCKAQGCKLFIKLHPESYKSTWLLQDENIEYIKDTDIVKLIKGANGVFGATSTLMLPAVYFKKTFLLLIHDSSFQKDLLDWNLAKGADFHDFKVEDIEFIAPDANNKMEFIHEYLYKVDGQSVIRLKEILKGSHTYEKC